jgi:signal transduction histidine kinase
MSDVIVKSKFAKSSFAMSDVVKKCWPRTLYGRLALVWLAALLVGHAIQNVYGYLAVYDDQVARNDYYLAKDIAIFLPQLEVATPVARQKIIQQMERQGYRYELNNALVTLHGASKESKRGRAGLKLMNMALGNTYTPELSSALNPQEDYRIQLTLSDGTPLTVVVNKTRWPIRWGQGVVFFIQTFAVIVLTWLAVKQATRPLLRLAEAAETLGTALDCKPIPEDGPSEVARAAIAFNRMQNQIKNHLAERMQILASISHDLQTPITRLRLRTELMEDEEQQRKWLADLSAMQALVEEGITYARSAQRTTEAICRVDVDALLDSVVGDYMDAGQSVSVSGTVGEIIATRPHALKRIITNVLDNALKFATDVELHISHPSPHQLAIAVLDRGPGIPEHELDAVLQPFYRLEHSRNRHTGGTGLGLAIAHQLSHALEGAITLRNRDGGGLEVMLVLSKNLPSAKCS